MKSKIGLAALLAVLGCGGNETIDSQEQDVQVSDANLEVISEHQDLYHDMDVTPTTHLPEHKPELFNIINSYSLRDNGSGALARIFTSVSLFSGDSFDEEEARKYLAGKCNAPPVLTDELDAMLDSLQSTEARVHFVTDYLDHLGFGSWVLATGGPQFECFDGFVPLSDRQIMNTINYHRDRNAIDIAAEVASDAGSAKRDSKYHKLARNIILEEARNPKHSDGARAKLFGKVIEYHTGSYEGNIELAEEAVDFFVKIGYNGAKHDFLKRLLPDEVNMEEDDGTVNEINIPSEIKERKDKLAAQLEAMGITYRSDTSISSKYTPLEGEFTDCKWLLTAAINHNEWGFKHRYGDLVREDQACDSFLVLKGLEMVGWYNHAEKLANQMLDANTTLMFDALICGDTQEFSRLGKIKESLENLTTVYKAFNHEFHRNSVHSRCWSWEHCDKLMSHVYCP